MSDDLLKRLEFGSLTTMGSHKLNLEAAARIRELEAELAALREARGVRVKPLVWQRQTYNSPDQVGHHASVYSIYESAETGNCVASSGAPYFWGPEHTDNLEAAKAAAQADYERRIFAAIEPAPVTPAEAARVLLVQPNKVLTPVFAAMRSKQDKGVEMMLMAALDALADAGEAG